MTKKKARPGAPSVRSSLPSARPEAGRIHRNPLDYDHPFPSMAEFAALLNLRHDSNRTRHAYYRDLRLLQEHFAKGPRIATGGFTAVLHTWNQRLLPHVHLHFLVPGAGLDASGRFATVRNANFLTPLPILRRAFKRRCREGLFPLGVPVDPAVWTKDWGVHLAPFGSGENAIKYLGAYVARTAIGERRIVSMTQDEVTFRWKDRARGGRQRLETIRGEEFCVRYLRHVLPRGMRAVRYFGFCHPSAKMIRERVAFLSGRTLLIGARPASGTLQPQTPPSAALLPRCPCCARPMPRLFTFKPAFQRGPPLGP